MTLVRALGLTALLAGLAAGESQKAVFDPKVERVRILHNQSGGLHIDAQGITFRSSEGKTRITIRMQDLREVDVADPSSLQFETFEVQKWKPTLRSAHGNNWRKTNS